jgi:TonB family protein
MIVMALVGLLAIAGPDAHPRVPGTRLRFGMLESQLLGLGAFAEVKTPDAGGMSTRKGPSKMFGIPGEAILYLSDGRLARVKFEAAGVSAHSRDYLEDELRRQRMVRVCQDVPDKQVCDWTGGPVVAHVEYAEEKLDVRFEPLVRPPSRRADTLRAGARGAATRPPPAARADKPPTPPAKPPAPGETRPADTKSADAKAPTTNPNPRPATPPTTPQPPTKAVVASPTAAVTLPETLTISLTSRNAPTDWPRIVSSPPLEYPEAARRESVQGVVWVLAFVDVDGRVRSAAIERGIRELDDAALAWVRGSKFAPCERHGSPCRFHVRVAVRYTLF